MDQIILSHRFNSIAQSIHLWVCEYVQWCKVIKYKFFKVQLKSCFGVSVLFFTIYIFDNFFFYSTTFLNNINNVLSTPYIFPDTQKYLLHFECLAGQKNGQNHTLINRTSLVILTASDLADSHKCFVCKWCLTVGVWPWLSVNDVWLLECGPGYL